MSGGVSPKILQVGRSPDSFSIVRLGTVSRLWYGTVKVYTSIRHRGYQVHGY